MRANIRIFFKKSAHCCLILDIYGVFDAKNNIKITLQVPFACFTQRKAQPIACSRKPSPLPIVTHTSKMICALSAHTSLLIHTLYDRSTLRKISLVQTHTNKDLQDSSPATFEKCNSMPNPFNPLAAEKLLSVDSTFPDSSSCLLGTLHQYRTHSCRHTLYYIASASATLSCIDTHNEISSHKQSTGLGHSLPHVEKIKPPGAGHPPLRPETTTSWPS